MSVDTASLDAATLLSPTRAAEAATAFEAAGRGHAVLVVAHPGEGRTSVAMSAAARTARGAVHELRCTPRTTAADLLGLREAGERAALLLTDVERLPAQLADVLEELTHQPGHGLFMTIDVAAVRARTAFGGEGIAAGLGGLSRRRLIHRLDLRPLPPEEVEELVRARFGGTFDDLQIATVVHAAHGSLGVAMDLIADASGVPPALVPRQLPRPWEPPVQGGMLSTDRAAARMVEQDEGLVSMALVLHRLGPVSMAVVSSLVGQETAARLTAAGLAVVERHAGEPTLHVDPLAACGLLLAYPHLDVSGISQDLGERLGHLWDAGLPLPGGAVLSLARARLREGRAAGSASLLLAASAVAAGDGQGVEAEVLAKAASNTPGEAPDPATLPALWQAQLLQHRESEVLAGAEDLFLRHPEQVSTDHLYRAAVAASWQEETPAWLQRHLEQHVDPTLRSLLLLHLREQRVDQDRARTLVTTGQDHRQPSILRHWALGLAVLHHLRQGDSAELATALEAVRQLQLDSAQRAKVPDPVPFEAELFLEFAELLARIAAGFDAPASARRIRRLSHNVVCPGPRSSRFAAAGVAFLMGHVQLLEGNHHQYVLDTDTAAHLLDHSVFASMHRILTRAHRDRADGRDTAPAWGRAVHLHRAVLAGERTAQAVLGEVGQLLRQAPFPTVAAIEAHLQAEAHQDPDELVAAAEQLRRSNQLAAAAVALDHARTLFSSRRQAARAGECTASLATLPSPAGTPRRPNPLGTGLQQTPPAGLSRREFEICLLVAEGLTNPQIAERLVVSVRTVETHVLQARAKLRARRRGDIPERLRRATA